MTEIATAVQRVLAERGPMAEDDLRAALTAAGVDLGRDPDETLEEVLDSEDLPLVLPLTDDRHTWLPGLLDGRMFTHRLDAAEAKHDLLAIEPDLEPVALLTGSTPYGQLADGGPLLQVLPDFDDDVLTERGVPAASVHPEGVVVLPAGRLAELGLGAGDLVGLRVTADGFEVVGVDEQAIPADGSAALDTRLRAVLDAHGEDLPEMLDAAIWTVCANDAELFRAPLPPLGELLDTSGFARERDHVALPGFDFGSRRAEHRLDSIARLHRLDEDQALAVLALATMYEQAADLFDAAVAADEAGELESFTAELAAPEPQNDVSGRPADDDPDDAGPTGAEPADDRQLVRDTVKYLADPEVAEAVLAETVGVGRDGAAALGMFAESLEGLAPRSTHAALRWLRAKAHERLGSIEDAEQTLAAAETTDPSWPPTLLDLARYASDRGDAERGLSLLRRAEVEPDDELVELLQQFLPQARNDLGRNQRCWCGSGRKYKHCHLGNEQLTLAERANWLYHKAGIYLMDGPWRADLIEAAQLRSRHWDSPTALLQAMGDPFMGDVVLFEGGAFAEFLDVRGFLLPDDERLLAEQWLLVERSVYEVETVSPGRGLTVRDLRTGDRHDVTERTASRQLTAGALFCARIVPAGDQTQIFGGLEPVALGQRDQLLELLDSEPGPLDLVAFLSARFAPPQLQNTEGEPVILCEATLRGANPDTLIAALDETYDRDESETEAPRWFEHVTTHGMERIRATLTLAGDELRVETNSEPRMDRVLDQLSSAVPSLLISSQSRQPAKDLADAMSRAPGAPTDSANPLDPDDPAIIEALATMTRQYEQSWLDDTIPALAGSTPREAAADPTRREDLIRLLGTFPAASHPGMMDPDRLRTALGLPDSR